MHKNPTEEHSRNVGGISKNIIGVLHSVAVLRGARVGKKRSTVVIFFLALLAFLRLESNRLKTGTSWYESKRAIQRSATILFVAQPSF